MHPSGLTEMRIHRLYLYKYFHASVYALHLITALKGLYLDDPGELSNWYLIIQPNNKNFPNKYLLAFSVENKIYRSILQLFLLSLYLASIKG